MNKLTPQMKVLVVDYQPLIVEELCEFLESNGYRCVPCHSSPQAVARFREDAEIGLVLCDLHMPDMDGIELVQELQRIAGKQRAFEAIMLTGRARWLRDHLPGPRIRGWAHSLRGRPSSCSWDR